MTRILQLQTPDGGLDVTVESKYRIESNGRSCDRAELDRIKLELDRLSLEDFR